MMTAPNNDRDDDAAGNADQPLTTPLTSFTDLLGLDGEAGQVCGPDGYCE